MRYRIILRAKNNVYIDTIFNESEIPTETRHWNNNIQTILKDAIPLQSEVIIKPFVIDDEYFEIVIQKVGEQIDR